MACQTDSRSNRGIIDYHQRPSRQVIQYFKGFFAGAALADLSRQRYEKFLQNLGAHSQTVLVNQLVNEPLCGDFLANCSCRMHEPARWCQRNSRGPSPLIEIVTAPRPLADLDETRLEPFFQPRSG